MVSYPSGRAVGVEDVALVRVTDDLNATARTLQATLACRQEPERNRTQSVSKATPPVGPLADLRAALETWAQDARQYLDGRPATEYMAGPGTSWHYISDDAYSQVPVVMQLQPELINALKDLTSYSSLEEVVKETPATARLLNRRVGTIRSTTVFTTWTLASAFLPELGDLITSRPAAFDERYATFEAQLNTGEVEHRTIYPIQGISFNDARVELSEDLAIERLTRDEIAVALDVGLLQPRFPNAQFEVASSNTFALKKTTRLPLVVGEPEEIHAGWDAESMRKLLRIQSFEEMGELLECLALLTDARVQFSGQLEMASGGGFLAIGAGTMTTPLPVLPLAPRGPDFTTEQCADLILVWNYYHIESFRDDRALGLAVRRLALATQRNMAEDRLLDIFIAAEALYLADASSPEERGELRYRLALRAAVWSEGAIDGWSKREVFRQMKLGYDARSVIAHGGVPEEKDVKIRGERVSLPELVKVTEDIVRAAAYKAMHRLSQSPARRSIPWDDLILGE
jgi:hypothetical protein